MHRRAAVHLVTAVLVALGLSAGGTTTATSAVARAGATAAAPELQWGPAVPIDPPSGSPSAISCTGPHFCVAVDRTGHVVTRRNGLWSRPRRIAHGNWDFIDVDCFAPHRCVALTFDGQLYRLSNGHWHAWQKTPRPAFSVSCTSLRFCGVLGGGQAHVWQHGAWRDFTLRADDTSVERASCGAPGTCIFALELRSGRDWAWTFANGRLRKRQSLGSGAMGAVTGLDCIGRHWCIARQEGGASERYNGRRWSPIDGSYSELNEVRSISCTSRRFCAAIGTADLRGSQVAASESFTGRRWATLKALPLRSPLNPSIGCASGTTFCVAVGDNGRSVVRTHAGWSRGTQLADRSWDELTGVSCGSTSLCVTTTLYYGYSAFDGHRWTRLHALRQSPDHSGYDATRSPMCVSARDCLEEDFDGEMRRFDGTTWTLLPQHLPSASEVSCGGAHFCLAIDSRGRVHLLDGSRWRIIRRSYPTGGLQFDCTRFLCMVLTDKGRFDVFNRSTRRWSGFSRFAPRSVTPMYGPAVSCVGRSFCMEVDGSHFDAIWDGTGWHRIAAPDGYNGALSCLSSDFCVADSNQAVVEWNGTGWSAPTVVLPYRHEEVDGVSCAGTPAEPRCAVIGFHHVVTTQ